jgi:hypothetical protein
LRSAAFGDDFSACHGGGKECCDGECGDGFHIRVLSLLFLANLFRLSELHTTA